MPCIFLLAIPIGLSGSAKGHDPWGGQQARESYQPDGAAGRRCSATATAEAAARAGFLARA